MERLDAHVQGGNERWDKVEATLNTMVEKITANSLKIARIEGRLNGGDD